MNLISVNPVSPVSSVVYAFVVAVALACQPSTETQGPVEQLPRDGAAYWPAATWRTAEPQQVGLDARRLDSLVQRLASNAIPGLHSLIVVRHGYVAVEEYFNGSSASQVHTMQSVTKSVTSLVAGIAIGEGKLSTNTRVLDLLPQYDSLVRGDERKRQVTIGHLLEMRSGINFHETPYPGSPLERLNTSQGDWVAIALGEPMNAAPGEHWQYNGGGVIALAAAVRAATGVPFAAYARQRLFQPLGITTERWFLSPFDGLPHTGGGLDLRAMDLARIGYLVLRRGTWSGVQVVPTSWIDESTRLHTTNPRSLGGYPTDYGFLWWLMPAGTSADLMITASGNLNQWLFVLPRHDLVVVVTGGANHASVPDFLIREILPSVLRN
jgi:CubicO group peptidase (beta-lactamase class C family)